MKRLLLVLGVACFVLGLCAAPYFKDPQFFFPLSSKLFLAGFMLGVPNLFVPYNCSKYFTFEHSTKNLIKDKEYEHEVILKRVVDIISLSLIFTGIFLYLLKGRLFSSSPQEFVALCLFGLMLIILGFAIPVYKTKK